MRHLLACLLLLLTLHSFGQQEFFEHFSNVTASISKTHFSGYEPELNVSGVNITDDTLHILVDDGAGCLAYEGWLQDSSQAVAPGHFSVSFQGESICDWLEEVNLVASECPFAAEDYWDMPLSCVIPGFYLFPYDYEDNGTPIAQFPSITFTSTFTDSFTPEFTVACPSNCGEGTVWDSILHQCVPDITFPTAPCGQGTVWDPVNEECIVAIPADTDFDGCVTAGDVLNLLATFGSCPPIPFSGPCQGLDHVTYHGYDYDIVAIGDQCWFAQNLRTELYANGDSIPASLSDGDWTSTDAGATAVYGEGNSNCTQASPVMDPCDEGASLAAFGRLYNWFAVDDSRNLCPTHWHVPTDSDWMDLEVSSGMDSIDVNNTGWRGTDEGLKLKSSNGWNDGGNGQDALGFNAQPAGGRHPLEGRFLAAGEGGYFWTSTPDGTSAWIRRLKSDYSQIDRWPYNLRNGYSVRCVRD